MRASQVLDRWYAFAYRFPSTPWERSARRSTASTGALLDREEVHRSRPPGRALDLGCGRGFHTAELARRGWQAVGVDLVPRAIEAACRRDIPGARFVVGDVTHLTTSGLGTFDIFLDVGCLQGFNAEERLATGREITTLANPGATMLILAFQPHVCEPSPVQCPGQKSKQRSPTGRCSPSIPPTSQGSGGHSREPHPNGYDCASEDEASPGTPHRGATHRTPPGGRRSSARKGLDRTPGAASLASDRRRAGPSRAGRCSAGG